VLDALLDYPGQVVHIGREAARHKAAVTGYRQGQRPERKPGPLRRCPGDKAEVAGGGGLPLGQAIDLVIVHHIGNVNVAGHRRDEVVAALPVAVTITADGDNSELMVGYLGGLGGRNRPTVQLIEDMALKIVGELTRLPDTGDHQHLVRLKPQGDQRPPHCGQDTEVAAARTPLVSHRRGVIF
jgi:hypothetical protein